MANFVTLKVAFHLTPEDRRCTLLPQCLQIRGDWVEVTPVDSKEVLCFLSELLDPTKPETIPSNKENVDFYSLQIEKYLLSTHIVSFSH